MKQNTLLLKASESGGNEGLRSNGRVRRVRLHGKIVIVELEDDETGEIFQFQVSAELEKGTPLFELLTKLNADFGESKLAGEIDLNAFLKGKPCQLIIARKPGAGGKFRLEVVLVLPPNTLAHVAKAA